MVYFHVLCSKHILMKLVGYQQPTCLCVKMEFVVGNHFAFMRIVFTFVELFSFTWASTIVYRKWFFHLHVECCGSCMVSTTGEGAGKFLGMRKIFARKVLGDFAYKFFPQRSWRPFLGNLQKRSACVFVQTLGAILWNQTRLGTIFSRNFRDFAQIFNKSKLLGVRFHPASYTTG